MVIRLDISKVEQGIYMAYCEARGEPTHHSSIAEALLSYGNEIPMDFARHVEVHYVDVSIGTQPVARLATHSEELARQLTTLAAEVWMNEEELASARIR